MFNKLKSAVVRATSKNRDRSGSSNSRGGKEKHVGSVDDTFNFDMLMERGENYRDSIHKSKEAVSRMSNMDQYKYKFD